MALARADGATLDDLREAVTTLEDTERCAARARRRSPGRSGDWPGDCEMREKCPRIRETPQSARGRSVEAPAGLAEGGVAKKQLRVKHKTQLLRNAARSRGPPSGPRGRTGG